MTKKHFIEVAKMIREIKSRREREILTEWFSVFFMKYNPRFDMRKFCCACLPE